MDERILAFKRNNPKASADELDNAYRQLKTAHIGLEIVKRLDQLEQRIADLEKKRST